MICILIIWLGTALTLVKPYFDYQFLSGPKWIRAYRSVVIAFTWPVVVFLVVRKRFLQHTIFGLSNA